MDFKRRRHHEGHPGFQLDLKINGLPFEIARPRSSGARRRREILKVIARSLGAPRKEIFTLRPSIKTIQVDPEKIGMLSGPRQNDRRITRDDRCADRHRGTDASGKVFI